MGYVHGEAWYREFSDIATGPDLKLRVGTGRDLCAAVLRHRIVGDCLREGR
jgi:hypothetical protein